MVTLSQISFINHTRLVALSLFLLIKVIQIFVKLFRLVFLLRMFFDIGFNVGGQPEMTESECLSMRVLLPPENNVIEQM